MIAEIEVVISGIVKIDGTFYQPHFEPLRVIIKTRLGVATQRRHVMQPKQHLSFSVTEDRGATVNTRCSVEKAWTMTVRKPT